MTQDEFTAKAEKVEQDTGIELMGIYHEDLLNEGRSKDGWVWDDGFYHYTKGTYRASYDVDSMDALKPQQIAQAKQKLRQAWYDDSDIQAKVDSPYTTQEFAEEWRSR
jgi:hypothetical protein